jgi:hypothetical protein
MQYHQVEDWVRDLLRTYPAAFKATTATCSRDLGVPTSPARSSEWAALELARGSC